MKYDDILYLERPKSKHQPMSIEDRAAQFSPFAALSGHSETMIEVARATDVFEELDENIRFELEREIDFLMKNKNKYSKFFIKYFAPDKRKNGGKYLEIFSQIKKYNRNSNTIILENGDEISIKYIEDIYGIEQD